MTPLRFEELYADQWAELERYLDTRQGRGASSVDGITAAHATALYRRACEHLALARARWYPAYLVTRLERITADAHQRIYYRQEIGLGRLRRLVVAEFPAAVRAHKWYVAAAAATFALPVLIIGLLVYWRPELILSVVSSDTAASFEQMYSPRAESIGRTREAGTDWVMFGFYIRNNIGVAFQCFAGGLFAGVGSLFFLGFNGAFSGALAGYLTARGLASTFYAFIATHSAFELTAIVISGAAGLRIGHAVLAPGRLPRQSALVVAARDAVPLLYGVTVLLVVAAAVEAFWSSGQWLPAIAKYSVAAVCWVSVIGYLVLQGRRAG